MNSPLVSGDSKLSGQGGKKKSPLRSKSKKKGTNGPSGGPKNLKFKFGKGIKQENKDHD